MVWLVMLARTMLVVVVVTLFSSTQAQECGGVVDTGNLPSGNIISPGYPNQYPADVLCTWIVKAPSGEKIVMDFADFDVTGSDGCEGDYLSMSDPNVKNGKESRYCGNENPGSVTSVGDTIVLTFKTNWQGSCRGFNASYAVERECITCGATSGATEFWFMSPEYPEPVGNDSLLCSITVEHGCSDTDGDDDGEPPGPICQLRLDFDEFQLQPPFWGDCLYDQFYAEAQHPLPILCGVNNGSHMYVNVEGRSKTDLTFLLKELEYYLYHCYDIYGPSNHGKEPGVTDSPGAHVRQRREANEPHSKNRQQKKMNEDLHHRNEDQHEARQGSFFQPASYLRPGVPDFEPASYLRPGVPDFEPASYLRPGVPDFEPASYLGPGVPDFEPASYLRPGVPDSPGAHVRQRREAKEPHSKKRQHEKMNDDSHHRNEARQGGSFSASWSSQGSAAGDGDPSSWYTDAPKKTTHKDVTVALYNYNESEPISFPTRRAWKIKVTQIPCDPCPEPRVPRAPEGCLQYYKGLTGEIKSFNYDGQGCYTEDRWCNFDTIAHPSDCDIRVGYTGHLNNLDYSMCVEPQSGFCGIQFQQVGVDGFSLSNISDYRDASLVPQAQLGDMECMSDYLFVPGAQNDHGKDTFERYCGTKMGNARKWATATTYSKPFAIRMVSDADEFSLSSDYMNRGFHLTYSQIPCKISG